MGLITKSKADFISLTRYLSSLAISVGQNKQLPYNTTIDQNGGEIISPFPGKLEHFRFYYHVSCYSSQYGELHIFQFSKNICCLHPPAPYARYLHRMHSIEFVYKLHMFRLLSFASTNCQKEKQSAICTCE